MGKPIPIEFETREIPLADIQEAVFLECLRHWENARGSRMMPARRDVRPETIKSAIGFVGIIDMLRGGAQLGFRYRMFGSLMSEAIGSDFTGQDLDDIQPPQYAAMLREAYEETAKRRRPVYHRVCFTHEEKQRIYYRLLLPLADDGENADRLWATTHNYEDFWVDLKLLLRKSA